MGRVKAPIFYFIYCVFSSSILFYILKVILDFFCGCCFLDFYDFTTYENKRKMVIGHFYEWRHPLTTGFNLKMCAKKNSCTHRFVK